MVTKKSSTSSNSTKMKAAYRQVRAMKAKGFYLERGAVSKTEAGKYTKDAWVPTKSLKNPIGPGYNIWKKLPSKKR